MTSKQRNKFLRHPNQCPFCGSEDLNEHDFDGDGAECDCEGCGESWMVEYKLVGAYQADHQMSED